MIRTIYFTLTCLCLSVVSCQKQDLSKNGIEAAIHSSGNDQANITLTMLDYNDNLLPSQSFNLFNVDKQQLISIKVSNASSKIDLSLPYGVYYLTTVLNGETLRTQNLAIFGGGLDGNSIWVGPF